jgi:hypothetical protein
VIFGGNLGWTDQVERIKRKMAKANHPSYTDQDGNDVPLCVVCRYYRSTNGDLCELCARTLAE